MVARTRRGKFLSGQWDGFSLFILIKNHLAQFQIVVFYLPFFFSPLGGCKSILYDKNIPCPTSFFLFLFGVVVGVCRWIDTSKGSLFGYACTIGMGDGRLPGFVLPKK